MDMTELCYLKNSTQVWLRREMNYSKDGLIFYLI